ncbi:hypothetical protein FC26_GL000531 [Paucilactobacillus vaccinostercus DSM 20634]|jgi:hypothetical protein|uniref:DUF2508 family protein n=1 Tax=Paucilactobacillus vaccinostercus DSM 20634 TaxID=1423813 RepID=A0A0R2A8P9_9LACO|nr:YaaL family protein [Paucilactobacillus vaccinostercus]KRM60443.1 hypothetical protein FC26_GL000531 [Paucilactobacillus vaccinostercus DSM 20634]
MFKKRARKVKETYDQQLLDLIYAVKADWDHAKETQLAVYESDVNTELVMQTKLQEQKFLYLFREARRRQVHGQLERNISVKQ